MRPKKKLRRKTTTALSPTKIPKGFVLLIDTREQKPLFVSPPDGLVVKHTKVDVGDYTVEGFEDRVCVERKQLSDFDSFMGRERNEHTIPKLKRMSAMIHNNGFSALVIECSEAKLFSKRRYGKMTPEHARGFLKKVEVGFHIPYHIEPNRAKLERYVLDSLCYAYEIMSNTKGV